MSSLFNSLLLCLGIALLFSCGQTEPTPSPSIPPKPHILWLVAEDMGSYLPSFGDSTIETPNLSRLAAQGIRYTNMYSPSPVCAPSRAAIATGMYPSSIGANHMRTHSYTEVTGLPSYEAVPPPEVKMFSELLREQGYYCTNNSKEDYQFRAPVTAWDESGREAHWRNRESGQPFFAIFNFGVTHESGLFEPYERDSLISKDLDFPIPPYLPDNETVRRDLWKMYNNIALLDQQVGKILDELEADGLLDSTIIFFYADHGGPLPRQKRLVYDAGLKVPMIIRFPQKQLAGTVEDRLLNFLDFAPTLLTLIGKTPPEYLQGQSFLGENQPEPRAYLHAAADRFDGFTDNIRAVRDSRYKYIRNYRPQQGYYLPVAYRERIPSMQELLRLRDVGQLDDIQALWFREKKPREELYDCQNDPHEVHDLAQDPAYAEKVCELSAEMDRWLSAIGDQPDLPEPQLITRLWEGGDTQPETAPIEAKESNGFLSLSCPTEGASIGYRFVSDSSETWHIYQSPIPVQGGDILELHAHRIGFKPFGGMAYQVKEN